MRPRAWAMAQRRHAARLWHREKGITAGQKAVLDALHHLPDQQRKVLLLTHLAALDVAEIGRELGERPSRVQERLDRATRTFCDRAGSAPDQLQQSLESLAPLVEATALPPPDAITRGGRRRRRLTLVLGTAVLLVLTVLGGLFVVDGSEPGSATAQAAPEAQPGDARHAAHRRPGAAPGPACHVAPAQHLRQHRRHRDQHRLPGRPVRRSPRSGHLRPRMEQPGTASPIVPPDGGDLAVPRGGPSGLPHHAGLVRRLPGGSAPAARRLPDAGAGRGGDHRQAPDPQRRTPHLRRRGRPHRRR